MTTNPTVVAFAIAEWLQRESKRFTNIGQNDEADALMSALMAVCAVYQVDPDDKVSVRAVCGKKKLDGVHSWL
jgi:hypothetical protein